ncbi:hypothetical protein Poli38472_014549 [Pythium oligandrum]|uniref:Uncharacterized protein n=1 Tax=Pythium oligandrum TaxID=41045 RepID=A0A8K1CEI7_PYTOL|nr:hypothetical protein Poli38472_014549 [Pythium oligandrum]|eukprot:TMW61088.1 hypothetical protein Poli38472_014549 [Pythium oligandrum]
MRNQDVRDARREQEELEALHRLDEECVHLQRAGNYLQAFDCMERALVLRRHFFGVDSVEVQHACKALAEMCNLLAMSFLQQDNFSVTLDLLKKAELLSQHHPADKATTLNNLACYYRRLGKLHTAMTCLKRALAIEQRLEHVRNAADTHLNLCAVLSQLGRHDQALTHAQAALLTLQDEFFRGGGEPAGDTSPTQQLDRVSVMCIAYHNMGVEQEFLKDFENAVGSYRKGVGMAEQYLGVDHAIATTIRNSYLAAKRTIASKIRQSKTSKPSSPRTLGVGGQLSPLRLPSPLTKDKQTASVSLTPRSIVADALAKGRTLPPLEGSPRTAGKSVRGLSPQDPFFSPRFRFDEEAKPLKKASLRTQEAIKPIEILANEERIEQDESKTSASLDTAGVVEIESEPATSSTVEAVSEQVAAVLTSQGEEASVVSTSEEVPSRLSGQEATCEGEEQTVEAVDPPTTAYGEETSVVSMNEEVSSQSIGQEATDVGEEQIAEAVDSPIPVTSDENQGSIEQIEADAPSAETEAIGELEPADTPSDQSESVWTAHDAEEAPRDCESGLSVEGEHGQQAVRGDHVPDQEVSADVETTVTDEATVSTEQEMPVEDEGTEREEKSVQPEEGVDAHDTTGGNADGGARFTVMDLEEPIPSKGSSERDPTSAENPVEQDSSETTMEIEEQPLQEHQHWEYPTQEEAPSWTPDVATSDYVETHEEQAEWPIEVPPNDEVYHQEAFENRHTHEEEYPLPAEATTTTVEEAHYDGAVVGYEAAGEALHWDAQYEPPVDPDVIQPEAYEAEGDVPVTEPVEAEYHDVPAIEQIEAMTNDYHEATDSAAGGWWEQEAPMETPLVDEADHAIPPDEALPVSWDTELSHVPSQASYEPLIEAPMPLESPLARDDADSTTPPSQEISGN